VLYQLSYFRNLFLLISSTFQRTNGIVPFCECKGTAFILITKQKHKKNHFFFVFFSKIGIFQPFFGLFGRFPSDFSATIPHPPPNTYSSFYSPKLKKRLLQ
jgi:hypothetical protein